MLVIGMLVRQYNVESAIKSRVKACAAPVRKHWLGRRRRMAFVCPLLGWWQPFLAGLLLAACCTASLHGATVTLQWYEPANGAVVGYNVYYGTTSQQYTDNLQTGPQPFCDVPGLQEGTTYYFVVTAVDNTGTESAPSAETNYAVPFPPPVVQVQASIVPDGNVLVWNETRDPNVVGYNVYFGTASHQYTNSVQAGPDLVATITGLAQGTTYYFAVTSTDSAGVESDFSQELTYTTLLFEPTAQVVAVLMPENYPLYWYVKPDTNVLGYDVYYGASSGDYTNSIQTGPNLVATITNLVEGTTYYFALAPYDNTGVEGVLSDERSYTVPVLDLTIQGTVLPNGLDAFEITGTAGKTYEVDGSPDGQDWTALGTGTIGPDGTLVILEPPGTLDTYPLDRKSVV